MFGLEWMQIILTAKRLHLRDRGETGVRYEVDKAGGKFHYILAHTFCHTRVRIGIMDNGTRVKYCWRCEFILSEESNTPPPPGESDVPAEESKVIYLHGKKSA